MATKKLAQGKVRAKAKRVRPSGARDRAARAEELLSAVEKEAAELRAGDAADQGALRDDEIESARVNVVKASDLLSEMVAVLEEQQDHEMMQRLTPALWSIWRARWDLGLHPDKVILVWAPARSNGREAQP
jgi:hypothetical protein